MRPVQQRYQDSSHLLSEKLKVHQFVKNTRNMETQHERYVTKSDFHMVPTKNNRIQFSFTHLTSPNQFPKLCQML